jgi:Glycosyl hydrolase family 26
VRRGIRNWAGIAVALCLPVAAGLYLLLNHPGLSAHSVSNPSRNPAEAPAPAPPAYAALPALPGHYLGVFKRSRRHLSFAPYQAFSTLAGAPVRIALYYSSWHEGFQIRFADQARAAGAVVAVQIQPRSVSLGSIAAGNYDRYLRQFAGQVRDFRYPVIIGFAHEMNGPYYSWGDQPKLFVASWRHVVRVFREVGAHNVTWLWTVHWSADLKSLRPYWPGARYVTWGGIDGYYKYPDDRFRTLFHGAITAMHGLDPGLPILLSENAVGPGTGNEPGKITDLFHGIWRNQLLGVIWFDVRQQHPPHHQDWLLEGRGAAVAAFRQGVRLMGMPK